MWNIKEQILMAAYELGIEVSVLTYEEKEQTRQSIMSKFIKEGHSHVFPLFEKIEDYVGTDVSESWMWISDYIKEDASILLFNPDDEKEFYSFSSGKDVVSIIGEIFNVEFYITNRNTDYLLGYNHSQCLIASGAASEWLERHEGYKKRYE